MTFSSCKDRRLVGCLLGGLAAGRLVGWLVALHANQMLDSVPFHYDVRSSSCRNARPIRVTVCVCARAFCVVPCLLTPIQEEFLARFFPRKPDDKDIEQLQRAALENAFKEPVWRKLLNTVVGRGTAEELYTRLSEGLTKLLPLGDATSGNEVQVFKDGDEYVSFVRNPCKNPLSALAHPHNIVFDGTISHNVAPGTWRTCGTPSAMQSGACGLKCLRSRTTEWAKRH